MNRSLAVAIAALAFAAVLAARGSVAQQRRADPPPAQERPVDRQPSADAVSPRAGEKKSPEDAPNAPGNPGTNAGGNSRSAGPAGAVKTLRLPEMQADLPDAPGRATVTVLCSACHSTRYITNQPPLPRETWIAEVTKMQKTYGAPVPDDKVAEIIDYLVAVRGSSKNR
jgi:hypothetical protein